MTLAISRRPSDAGSSRRRPSLYLVPPITDSAVFSDDGNMIDSDRDTADVGLGYGGAAARWEEIPRQRASAPQRSGRTAPAMPRASTSPRPVRLTRRGRVVLGLLLLGFAIGLAVLLSPPTQAATPVGPPRAVVVHSGDTLWSIATAALPYEDPASAINRVRVFNHLPDNRVYVGQQLLLPAS